MLTGSINIDKLSLVTKKNQGCNTNLEYTTYSPGKPWAMNISPQLKNEDDNDQSCE